MLNHCQRQPFNDELVMEGNLHQLMQHQQHPVAHAELSLRYNDVNNRPASFVTRNLKRHLDLVKDISAAARLYGTLELQPADPHRSFRGSAGIDEAKVMRDQVSGIAKSCQELVILNVRRGKPPGRLQDHSVLTATPGVPLDPLPLMIRRPFAGNEAAGLYNVPALIEHKAEKLIELAKAVTDYPVAELLLQRLDIVVRDGVRVRTMRVFRPVTVSERGKSPSKNFSVMPRKAAARLGPRCARCLSPTKSKWSRRSRRGPCATSPPQAQSGTLRSRLGTRPLSQRGLRPDGHGGEPVSRAP